MQSVIMLAVQKKMSAKSHVRHKKYGRPLGPETKQDTLKTNAIIVIGQNVFTPDNAFLMYKLKLNKDHPTFGPLLWITIDQVDLGWTGGRDQPDQKINGY